MEQCTGDDMDEEYWQMSGTSAYFVAVAPAAIISRRDNRQPLPLPLNRKDAGNERYEVGKLGDFRPWGTKDGMSVAIKASPNPACVGYTASWEQRKALVAAAYVASGVQGHSGCSVCGQLAGGHNGCSVGHRKG